MKSSVIVSGFSRRLALAFVLGASALFLVQTDLGSASSTGRGLEPRGAVYAMTNEADGNRVVAYQRASNGQLRLVGRFRTGGEGTGRIRLSSQNPVILNENNTHLYVVDVGSDEISAFSVRPNARLRLIDKVSSGGTMPYSLALSPDESLLYVLNNGGMGAGNITGFEVNDDGELTPLRNSTRPLSGNGTDPAQISFTPDGNNLVVTEKESNRILTYSVDGNGRPSAPTVHASSGETPFGFAFTSNGEFVVTEAFDGIPGRAAASSYSLTGPSGLRTISPSVGDGHAEVCWTAISRDERYAYVTNFGDGTISSYTVGTDGTIKLLEDVAATTTPGELSVRDHDFSENGRFLYAIDIKSRKVHAWRLKANGRLEEIGAFAGLPATVAGMAAS